jgi:hypothetical protein
MRLVFENDLRDEFGTWPVAYIPFGGPDFGEIRGPFEGATMPAYFISAFGRAKEVRPTLILTNRYDATITDMYFASAAAQALRAGSPICGSTSLPRCR